MALEAEIQAKRLKELRRSDQYFPTMATPSMILTYLRTLLSAKSRHEGILATEAARPR